MAYAFGLGMSLSCLLYVCQAMTLSTVLWAASLWVLFVFEAIARNLTAAYVYHWGLMDNLPYAKWVMTPSALRIVSVMVVKTLRRAMLACVSFLVARLFHAQQAVTTAVLQVLLVMVEAKTPATLGRDACPQKWGQPRAPASRCFPLNPFWPVHSFRVTAPLLSCRAMLAFNPLQPMPAAQAPSARYALKA